MNSFYEALESGYSPDQILDFLSKAIPQISKPISKARRFGYPAQQIIGFLSKSFDKEDRRGMSESERHAANRRADAERTKFGLKAVGAAVAAPILGGVVRNAISRALPGSLQQGVSQSLLPNIQSTPNDKNQNGIASGPMQGMPPGINSQTSAQQPPISEVAPSIPQAPNLTQPVIPQRDIKKSVDILKGIGQEASVKNMLEKGMNPKDIAGVVKQFMPKDQWKALEKSEGGIEGLITDYAQSIQDMAKEPIKTLENAIPEAQPILESPTLIEEPKPETKPIEKKSLVSSPQGIGEVKEIRNGKALVDIDGKVHQVDEEDLEAEPEDIADLYDSLFKAIPDQYKSRMMNYAGYDEEANELLFRPHGGAAYVYKNIPQEFAEDLKNRLHRAKTTGKNMYGMWYEGDQSYGAGMSKLIKELQAQYGGKGKEYVRKYNTLFDILGVPHEAKKRREQERRKAKRSS